MGALKVGTHVSKALTEDDKVQLLELVTQGKSFSRIADYFGMSRYGFYLELERHPQLKVQVDKLREHSTHELVDDLVERVADHPDPRTARNILQATQFVVAAKNRKDYGSKVDINVHKTFDISGLLDAAESRVVIEHTHQSIETTAQLQESTTGLEPETDHPLKARDRSDFEDLL